MRISVIGAGAFGTAMAVAAARAGNEVSLWAHDPDVAATIRETGANPDYLAGMPLSDRIHATNDLGEAATFSDTMFMVVPSHHYREVLTNLRGHCTAPVKVISGTKGIENESLERMSEITSHVLDGQLAAFAVFSGPTFAIETARGDPTAAVIASKDAEFAQEVQQVMSSPALRLYHSSDVVGVELAGALKNVIAIAAGVVEGLGLGHNALAGLITRGLAEITRLACAAGAHRETLAGLAGLGDLVLTCTGSLSRNRHVGSELAQGRSLPDVLAGMKMVAEGVRTTEAALALGVRHDVELPIAAQVGELLAGRKDARTALYELMLRPQRAEAG
jgi:glycerol-3-phosphate dehydrogenase (NAD(P)+)